MAMLKSVLDRGERDRVDKANFGGDMEANELLTNLLKGNRSMVRKALDGLSDEEVAARPNSECNSMAWLLWHLCRVEDGIVSALDGPRELWADGWAEKCGISTETKGMGFGHKLEDLESFGVGSVEALKEYFGQTEKKVADYLASLTPEDLDKQVPAMMGDGTVPLAAHVQILVNEALVHGGQIAYLRGLHKGMGWFY